MTGTREVKIQNRGINRKIKKTRVYKTKTVFKYSAGLIPKLTGKQRRQVYARNIVTAKFIKELREKSFFINDIILNSQKTLTAFRGLIRYFRRYKIRYRKLIVPYKKSHGFTRPKKARRL